MRKKISMNYVAARKIELEPPLNFTKFKGFINSSIIAKKSSTSTYYKRRIEAEARANLPVGEEIPYTVISLTHYLNCHHSTVLYSTGWLFIWNKPFSDEYT
ncbi:hypothetical protein [Sporosarcina sp. P3]|uniref:hypothetical protein n=1 Tax=Sporosarcina sp. P3 TaxID=2048245 RepID=UPI00117AADFA|nr:hypothetical protein [Sporosarcina sp. P3]